MFTISVFVFGLPPPLRFLQLPAEARAIAIRGDNDVVVTDQNRGSLQLGYLADALISVGDITPAEVVDSDTRHAQSMAMLENVLQILDAEVAPRDAFSCVLREVKKSGFRRGGLLVNSDNHLSAMRQPRSFRHSRDGTQLLMKIPTTWQ